MQPAAHGDIQLSRAVYNFTRAQDVRLLAGYHVEAERDKPPSFVRPTQCCRQAGMILHACNDMLSRMYQGAIPVCISRTECIAGSSNFSPFSAQHMHAIAAHTLLLLLLVLLTL